MPDSGQRRTYAIPGIWAHHTQFGAEISKGASRGWSPVPLIILLAKRGRCRGLGGRRRIGENRGTRIGGNRGTPYSLWDRTKEERNIQSLTPFVPLASHTTIVPSHFNATPAQMRTRAVQGRRRYARTRRRSSIPTTSRPLPMFSGGGSWAEPLLQTAHRRIPTEGVRFRASPS